MESSWESPDPALCEQDFCAQGFQMASISPRTVSMVLAISYTSSRLSGPCGLRFHLPYFFLFCALLALL